MEQLYTAEQSRLLDRLAIEGGQPGITLMRRAGQAVFEMLVTDWPSLRHLSICCGRGNNAGDGYVVAGLALAQGLGVELIQIGDPADLTGDAAAARDEALAVGVKVVRTDDGAVVPCGEVIVDALLGTGIQGAPRPAYTRLIEAMNASGQPVVAVDIPSGVAADSGAVAGAAVRAHTTVTFIGRKIGLHTGAGAALAGKVRFASLGVGRDVLERVEGLDWLTFGGLASAVALPSRTPDAYKQSLGHVVIAGGDHSMGGAVLMAAEGALRTGAGMVTVITRAQHRSAILARRPEAMVLDADDAELSAEVLAKASVCVLGPGLGRRDWGRSLFSRVIEQDKPLVIDADGLYWLAQTGASVNGALITPHAAEAGALLGRSVARVQHARLDSTRELAERAGGVAVLKGAGTVIASSARSRCIGICAHGNAGMASAGMGDVLSGVAGSLLGQGMTLEEAALLAVCLHSAAGDNAAKRFGQASLLATDLVPEMIELLKTAGSHAAGGG